MKNQEDTRTNDATTVVKRLLNAEPTYEQLELSVNGVGVRVAFIHREGPLAPAVFLHGFGSSKEDYIDLAYRATFSGRPFMALDLPGCGETLFLQRLGIQRFHLVGHSMGGLTALMLALRNQDRVLSFVDIKGNLAPEDCFLSRQIFTHPSDDPADFLRAFIERTRRSPSFASAFYAAGLPSKVRVGAIRGIFESMVRLSDDGDLLLNFLSLPFPRMFMYGEQNASLTYLERLGAEGVELAEIPYSGHFPMYSNPVEMWRRIAQIWRCSEAGPSGPDSWESHTEVTRF
ncbi:putative hydrolase or acyltransferase of alpha/beta superfamily [Cadophora sp. DSE1049]|nr:putative hydrolase or acyltransferase of alpha/beta superfamily [Cadophora sp. DSE1049]